MYTLVQNQNFLDDIQLQKADGTTETLHVSFLITPDLVKKFRQLRVKLLDIQKEIKSGAETNAVLFNETLQELFETFLGKENVAKLLEFYRQDFVQFSTNIMPYIYNVIIPYVENAAKLQKKALRKRKF